MKNRQILFGTILASLAIFAGCGTTTSTPQQPTPTSGIVEDTASGKIETTPEATEAPTPTAEPTAAPVAKLGFDAAEGKYWQGEGTDKMYYFENGTAIFVTEETCDEYTYKIQDKYIVITKDTGSISAMFEVLPDTLMLFSPELTKKNVEITEDAFNQQVSKAKALISEQITARNKEYFEAELLNNCFIAAESEAIYFGPEHISFASSEEEKICLFKYTITDAGIVLTDADTGETQTLPVENKNDSFEISLNKLIQGRHFTVFGVKRPYYQVDQDEFNRLYSQVKNGEVVKKESKYTYSFEGKAWVERNIGWYFDGTYLYFINDNNNVSKYEYFVEDGVIHIKNGDAWELNYNRLNADMPYTLENNYMNLTCIIDNAGYFEYTVSWDLNESPVSVLYDIYNYTYEIEYEGPDGGGW